MDKHIVRKEYLRLRNLLTNEEILKKSSEITTKLLKTYEYRNSKVIMLYMDFRNEVKTQGIIENCILDKKSILIPYINLINGKKEMQVSKVLNIEKDLQVGMYGILEPKPTKYIDINRNEIDLVIVPGIAFDKQKNRVGYGEGFYDKFLKTLKKQCLKLAIAYDIQICDLVDSQPSDVKMDLIITETKII